MRLGAGDHASPRSTPSADCTSIGNREMLLFVSLFFVRHCNDSRSISSRTLSMLRLWCSCNYQRFILCLPSSCEVIGFRTKENSAHWWTGRTKRIKRRREEDAPWPQIYRIKSRCAHSDVTAPTKTKKKHLIREDKIYEICNLQWSAKPTSMSNIRRFRLPICLPT